MTATEAKQIHASILAYYRDIEETINDIEQTLFEIYSCIALPIELCQNKTEVLHSISINKRKLKEQSERLKRLKYEKDN
jgi:hypothetical protein